MPIEAESNGSKHDMIEEINLRFQPIELLFDVMSAADSGEQGVFVRKWAEIGTYLATNFREYLDQLLIDENK